MKKAILLVLSATLLTMSCATSRSAISLGANLQNYRYAYVLADAKSTPFMLNLEKKIFDGLLKSRLQMVYAGQIDKLSDAQKASLLRVLISYSEGSSKYVSNTVSNTTYTDDGTATNSTTVESAVPPKEGEGTLFLYFQDHNSQRAVASCSGIGFTPNESAELVIREALALFSR